MPCVILKFSKAVQQKKILQKLSSTLPSHLFTHQLLTLMHGWTLQMVNLSHKHQHPLTPKSIKILVSGQGHLTHHSLDICIATVYHPWYPKRSPQKSSLVIFMKKLFAAQLSILNCKIIFTQALSKKEGRTHYNQIHHCSTGDENCSYWLHINLLQWIQNQH